MRNGWAACGLWLLGGSIPSLGNSRPTNSHSPHSPGCCTNGNPFWLAELNAGAIIDCVGLASSSNTSCCFIVRVETVAEKWHYMYVSDFFVVERLFLVYALRPRVIQI